MESLNEYLSEFALTYDVFMELKYLSWVTMYRQSKIPFNRLIESTTFDIEEGSLSFSDVNIYTHAMEMPIEEIPMYMNSPSDIMKKIVKWRLELDK